MAESAGNSAGASGGASSGEGTGQSQSGQAQSQATQAAETTAKAEAAEGSEPIKAEGETKETKETAEVKETKEVTPEKKPYRWAERLAKEFPDRKYESDDDYDKAMDEHLDNLEGYRERGKVANQKLISIFQSEPAVGSFMRDVMDGSSVRAALARHFDPSELVPQEGDDDHEAWLKNKTDREERMTKKQKRDADYEANTKATNQAIEEFVTENKWDDAAAGDFLGYVDQVISDIMGGKLTKDTLMMFKRARDYAADMQRAADEAKIAGRNEKIVAEREAEEPKGDGLPKLSSTTPKPEPPKKPQQWIDGLLETKKARTVIE